MCCKGCWGLENSYLSVIYEVMTIIQSMYIAVHAQTTLIVLCCAAETGDPPIQEGCAAFPQQEPK